MTTGTEIVRWIVNNWDKIPIEEKTNIQGKSLGNDDERTVVLLLDRQKPSVERSYDFNEERIGVTRTGKIVWGFDSGCSCPTPWYDNDDAYIVSSSWKEFEISLKEFDKMAIEEVIENFNKLKARLEK